MKVSNNRGVDEMDGLHDLATTKPKGGSHLHLYLKALLNLVWNEWQKWMFLEISQRKKAYSFVPFPSDMSLNHIWIREWVFACFNGCAVWNNSRQWLKDNEWMKDRKRENARDTDPFGGAVGPHHQDVLYRIDRIEDSA